MPYMTAEDGVHIWYTKQGKGKPIFLIHGWTMNHKFFKYNIDRLAKTNCVVTMDIRAHGYSSKQELNWTLGQAARDCKKIIDYLGLKDVTLVGWSMGTTLIFNYFEQFGYENIKGAVFIDMTPYPLKEDGWDHCIYGTLDLKASCEFERDILTDPIAVREGFIPPSFRGGEVPDESTKEWWLRESMLTPTGAMIAFWISMVAHDWRSQLAQIKVPILLCYGAESAIYPTKLGDYMKENIPNSTLVIFENSGHALFWEEHEKFNTEVANFAS